MARSMDGRAAMLLTGEPPGCEIKVCERPMQARGISARRGKRSQDVSRCCCRAFSRDHNSAGWLMADALSMVVALALELYEPDGESEQDLCDKNQIFFSFELRSASIGCLTGF